MEHRDRRGAGRRVLIEDPHRFDGVRETGVDEQAAAIPAESDQYVTVSTDLASIRDGTRSRAAAEFGREPIEGGVPDLAQRARHALARRSRDGCDGRVRRFKTATNEKLADAIAVIAVPRRAPGPRGSARMPPPLLWVPPPEERPAPCRPAHAGHRTISAEATTQRSRRY